MEENSTLSISLIESGSNFESNQTEISYDSFGAEANLTYETENISDSGVINSIDNEINTTGIMINDFLKFLINMKIISKNFSKVKSLMIWKT